MLLVDHCVAKSKIHGLGVFAKENIKEGAIVWRFNPVIDREIPYDAISDLPVHSRRQIMNHASFIPNRNIFLLGCDGDYFMNHSDDPSLMDDGEMMFATRDIAIGEELTCDYRVVKVMGFDPERNQPHHSLVAARHCEQPVQ